MNPSSNGGGVKSMAALVVVAGEGSARAFVDYG